MNMTFKLFIICLFCLTFTLVNGCDNSSTKREIIGTWRQHVNGRPLADFRVTFNKETRQFEMTQLDETDWSGGTDGISNIQYNGTTWSFDSDWGHKTATFVLKKMDNKTFSGVVDGNQNNMWVKID